MARAPGSKTYFALGVVFGLILITHWLGWLTPVERLLRSFIIPVFGGASSLSIKVGDNYRFFKDKDEFIGAYQACVSSTADDLVNLTKLQVLQNDNDELRQELGFKKQNNYTLITSDVVGRDIESIDQTILLNRGSDDGVALDMPVIAGSGILVGKIIKVNPDTSVVRLVNDNLSRVGATILNHDKSLGVVEGGFGISLQMNLIPRDEVVQVGDMVITSGLEAMMPRGLVIGTVESVENEAYQPFQDAILTPGIDLSKLSIVSVIQTQ